MEKHRDECLGTGKGEGEDDKEGGNYGKSHRVGRPMQATREQSLQTESTPRAKAPPVEGSGEGRELGGRQNAGFGGESRNGRGWKTKQEPR